MVCTNLEGQSSPGTEVVQSDLWRNSLEERSAQYTNDVSKHTL